VLEGRFGFYQAWLSGQFRPEELTDQLGDRWAVTGVFFKPYPANHFTHGGIDAARRLRAAGLEPAQVEAATLEVAPPTVRTIGEPIRSKRRPESGYHAKFSGPYTVAAALHGGSGLGLGLTDFSDDAAARGPVRSLMDRVDVVGDGDLLRIYPYQFPARLTVRTRDGSTLVEEVLVNRGGPDDPLSDAELAAKFDENAGITLEPATVGELRRALEGFDTADEVAGALAPAAVA
jgi:2-methylcitrate dehydratase PrpD